MQVSRNSIELVTLPKCVVLGTSGYLLETGWAVNVNFHSTHIELRTEAATAVKISYAEVDEITITGPGAVTKGGGFIGGGFGIEAAIEGMAIASVLNALTTRTKIHTFITFVANHGEIHLHYGEMEPGALRIRLAPIYTTLRWRDPAWAARRLGALSAAKARGIVTDDDEKIFESALMYDHGKRPSYRQPLQRLQ